MEPNDRVPQSDDERLTPDQGPGAEDCMSQAKLASLARVEVFEVLPFEGQLGKQLLASGLAQEGDQFAVEVKVIFDGSLAGPGDKEQASNSGEGQLLDDILHDGLAADWKHLLGLALGGRQQARPLARDRHDGEIDAHFQNPQILPLSRSPASYWNFLESVSIRRAAAPSCPSCTDSSRSLAHVPSYPASAAIQAECRSCRGKSKPEKEECAGGDGSTVQLGPLALNNHRIDVSVGVSRREDPTKDDYTPPRSPSTTRIALRNSSSDPFPTPWQISAGLSLWRY